MNKNIPVWKPSLTDMEYEAALTSLKEGWLGPGKYVCEFEKRIADYVGVDPAQVVAVSTGTAAVHMGLIACGVKAGDEVITPSFNNIADFQMIRLQSAEPVFCDIAEESLTIDPSCIHKLISKKTKALICIDYGTELCAYDEIKSICNHYGIGLIYDAAHSFGSARNGVMVGKNSDVCVFSFDPVKTLTCIDGGAIILNDIDLAAKLRTMRQLGQEQNQELLYQNKRSWTYDVTDKGFRYHLANLHAAIGIQQMNRVDDIIRKRQLVFQRYLDGLKGLTNLIKLPNQISDDIAPFIFVVRVLQGRRTEFRDYLLKHNIDTGIHWKPGHQFSYLKDCRSDCLRTTNLIGDEIVTLPCYPDLPNENIERIVSVIHRYYKHVLIHNSILKV